MVTSSELSVLNVLYSLDTHHLIRVWMTFITPCPLPLQQLALNRFLDHCICFERSNWLFLVHFLLHICALKVLEFGDHQEHRGLMFFSVGLRFLLFQLAYGSGVSLFMSMLIKILSDCLNITSLQNAWFEFK